MQVITGDLINSVHKGAEHKMLVKALLEELSLASNGQYEFFIRGDSFQVLLEKGGLKEALKIKIALFSALNQMVRISIGIGAVTELSDTLSNSSGPAFWLSGKGLDKMKEKGELLSIHSENEALNAEWKLHAATLDYLEQQLTKNKSEVIYWLLQSKNQTEIAQKIGIAQSSVNRRIKSSGWDLIEKIIAHYEKTID